MNRLLTPWGEKLDRAHPLQEYPRPQLRRESYLNLNGVWRYAIRKGDGAPDGFDGEIVVPFAPESVLSGVERQLRPGETLWYERTFTLPDGFRRIRVSREGEPPAPEEGRVLLHFGAADQVADVWVNGGFAVHHEGGYLPFSADITALLRPGENTLRVKVTDSLTDTQHAYGKQRYRRGGIWYTATSGIWQTVWMEAVPENHIEALEITVDFDARLIRWRVQAAQPDGTDITIKMNGTVIAEDWTRGETAESRLLERHCIPWTPERPFLYEAELRLGDDEVRTYFALRKFGTAAYRGHRVLALNNRPYFQSGLLDQGYWSDGLYTPPADEAMIYDIGTMKSLGFNMLRKHIKIEPLRWYYHCDRLGMIVWQDMVSGGGPYRPLVISSPLLTGKHFRDGRYDWFGRKDPAGRRQYEADLTDTVRLLYNCPCIALWTPFNEGWGQFDALRIAAALRRLDPTRLIDHASGWHDQGGGDLSSHHVYFRPIRLKNDGRRVLALTEFGGYSLPVEGHIQDKKFGYRLFRTAAGWLSAYVRLYERQVRPLIETQGLSAAVYTELSDVEDELNGLLTYDRRVLKADGETLRRVNRGLRFQSSEDPLQKQQQK